MAVGGFISCAPKDAAAKAKWLDCDIRHMLSEPNPKPEQITIAICSGMIDTIQMCSDDDIGGNALENNLKLQAAWVGPWADTGPALYTEDLKRLRKNGIQL